MGLSHRALVVWFCMVMGVVLASVYMDGGAVRTWDAFALLTPLWLIELTAALALLLDLGRVMRQARRRRVDVTLSPPTDAPLVSALCSLGMLALLAAFQVLLCVKMNGYWSQMRLVYAMVPLWLFLAVALTALATRVYRVCQLTFDKHS